MRANRTPHQTRADLAPHALHRRSFRAVRPARVASSIPSATRARRGRRSLRGRQEERAPASFALPDRTRGIRLESNGKLTPAPTSTYLLGARSSHAHTRVIAFRHRSRWASRASGFILGWKRFPAFHALV